MTPMRLFKLVFFSSGMYTSMLQALAPPRHCPIRVLTIQNLSCVMDNLDTLLRHMPRLEELHTECAPPKRGNAATFSLHDAVRALVRASC